MKIIPKIAIIAIVLGIIMFLSHYVPNQYILVWHIACFIIGVFVSKIFNRIK